MRRNASEVWQLWCLSGFVYCPSVFERRKSGKTENSTEKCTQIQIVQNEIQNLEAGRSEKNKIRLATMTTKQSRFFGSTGDDSESSDDEVEVVVVQSKEKPDERDRCEAKKSTNDVCIPVLRLQVSSQSLDWEAPADDVERVKNQSAHSVVNNEDQREEVPVTAKKEKGNNVSEAPQVNRAVHPVSEATNDISAAAREALSDVITVHLSERDDPANEVDVEPVEHTDLSNEGEVAPLDQCEQAVQFMPLPEKTMVEVKNKETQTEKENAPNPFAQFAFGAAPLDHGQRSGSGVRRRNWIVSKKEDPKKKKPKAEAKEKKEWKPMAELPPEERERVLKKWHGLADPSAALEDRRFEVMVASRLHARCQEPTVRKSMKSLRDAGTLTCAAMAQADPEVLASLVKSLQYYNTKSKHLVQASRELMEQFGGLVPESKDDLLKLTGIGPVMADLLSNVNTRAAYEV